MSSPACPLPYSTNPASRRGVPPSPPAPRIRGGDRREVGRELDDGDIEPWTMFIAERASMFPPAAVIGAQKA